MMKVKREANRKVVRLALCWTHSRTTLRKELKKAARGGLLDLS